jgi:hypothetical protein
MVKTEFMDLYEELSLLNEASRDFKDSEFPPTQDLVKQKIYILKDNYWLGCYEAGEDPSKHVQQCLLDPDNTKYVIDNYVKSAKDLEDVKFVGIEGAPYLSQEEKVFFLPKGMKLQFVKDIIINHMVFHMFSTGKVAFIFGGNSELVNYLQ